MSLALKIAFGYLVAGLCWIWFSDRAADVIFDNPATLAAVQTYKGFFYVFLSSGLLYLLIASYAKKLMRAQIGVQRLEREIVERLSLAAEFRDDETGNHVRRVGMYCGAIARAYGMAERDASNLELAACLHDLGKIGIPDNVMLKEGPFDEEDRQVMRAHTLIGSTLLAGGETLVLKVAEQIALTHHEHWDGSGYPGGLVGEEIPIEGRICAIADVFDALISRRRYKEEWSLEEALQEIEKHSGKQFDPNLVAIFRQILPEIEAIREQYPDLSTLNARYQVAA